MYGASFLCFLACLIYLFYFAGRRVCQDVGKSNCMRSLPVGVFGLLSLSLTLRALWCALRWSYWKTSSNLDPRWMMVVLELPLLFQFSAFSAITLSWINVHGVVSHRRHRVVKAVLLCFNISLFCLFGGSLIGSFVSSTAQGRADWTTNDRHQLYHKIYLVDKVVFCMLLAVFSTVFGLRLHHRLSGSAHISESIRRSARRIVMATFVCCFSFALRAVIFGSTTITYNFMELDDSYLDTYIYPLVVYTLPGCMSSGAIITIMFDTTVASPSCDVDEADDGFHDDDDGGSSRQSQYSFLECADESI